MKKLKIWNKRWITIIGFIFILVSMFYCSDIVLGDSNAIVQANLDYVLQVYPSGSYFSKDGQACGHSSGSTCNNCKVQNVPSRGGLPAGNAVGADDSWTCIGFAKYVFYCLTGTAWGNSKNTVYENKAYSDVYKYASVGDYVYYSGHAGIFIRGDATGYWMYEANYTYTNQVKYCGYKHTEGPCKIVHAYNYTSPTLIWQDSEKPVVTELSVANKTVYGFDVTVKATDDSAVSLIQIAVWNDKIGVNNAKWTTKDAVNSSASFHINTADFNNEQNTTYHVNAYAFDASGNTGVAKGSPNIVIETVKPQVTELTVTDISKTGFNVTVKATDNTAVSSIQIAVWNDKIGVNNAKWTTKDAVNSSASFRVNTTDFNNEQNTTYHVNAYAFDTLGNVSSVKSSPNIVIETEKPQVTDLTISNVTIYGFDVTVKATDNTAVSSIQIAVWNDKITVDNAKWTTKKAVNSSASFHVNTADFNNEQNTTYHVNAYAFDASGNISDAKNSPSIVIETVKPQVTELTVSNVTTTGFDVTVKATDNTAVSSLQIAVWNDKIGVDNAKWTTKDAVNSSADFSVSLTDFDNEIDSIYHVNAYAFDTSRNSSEVKKSPNIKISNTVNQELNEAKATAKNEVNNVKPDDYVAADQEKVRTAIATANNDIDAAATIEAVEAAVTAFNNTIQGCTTQAEQELDNAKLIAKKTVSDVDLADYVLTDQETVSSAKTTALNAINAATTTAAINAALETFNNTIKGCKKQADQDLEDAKAAAKSEVNGVNPDDYITDHQETVRGAKGTAITTIEAATTIGEVEVAVATFNNTIQACTKKADQELDNARAVAKRTVSDVDPADYVLTDQETVNSAKTTALNAINAAATTEAVDGALAIFNSTINGCKKQKDQDLIDAKSTAKAEVDAVDPTDYVLSDQEKVSNAKTTAISAIDAAVTEEAVAAAKTAFYSTIQNCTKQADQNLIDAKSTAKAEVNAVNSADYVTDDQEKVNNATAEALAAIDSATTPEMVAAAVTTFNNTIKGCTKKDEKPSDNQPEAPSNPPEGSTDAAPNPAPVTSEPDAGSTEMALPISQDEPITIEKVPSSVKVKVKGNRVTVSWKKIKKTKKTKKLLKLIKGIQVQYAFDKAFTQEPVTRNVGKSKTKVTLKLQKKKTYFIRVRYVGSDGYSKWTKPKKCKTK